MDKTDEEKILFIQKNLDETHIALHAATIRLIERGNTFEESETRAEALVNVSAEFWHDSLPAWKRYVYSWKPPAWWCCYRWCSNKKKQVKDTV